MKVDQKAFQAAFGVALNGVPAQLRRIRPGLVEVRSDKDRAVFLDRVVETVLARGGDFETRERRWLSV